MRRGLAVDIHYPLVHVTGHVIQTEIVRSELIHRVGDHTTVVQRTADTHHITTTANEVSLHHTEVFLTHITRMITAPRINLTLNGQTVLSGNRGISGKFPLRLGRQTIAGHKDTVGDIHLTLCTIAIQFRTTTILRNIGSIHEVFVRIEDKLIANPLVTRTIHRHGLLRILRANLLVRIHLVSCLLLPLILVSLVIGRLQVSKRRNNDCAGIDQRHLVNAVGTPLAICHSLLPRHTYDRIERESRVLEIVVLIRIVVGQVLTPYLVVRTRLIYQLRSYCTEHELQPMEILIPVEVRHLILIHVE